jgi:hypothetical protein
MANRKAFNKRFFGGGYRLPVNRFLNFATQPAWPDTVWGLAPLDPSHPVLDPKPPFLDSLRVPLGARSARPQPPATRRSKSELQ